MQYLLDADTCISVFRNEPNTLAHLSAKQPADCAISTITSYELYTGVEKCADPAREGVKVQTLLKTVLELPFDVQAAREAARVRATLESVGRPIGPYDTLLAGQAIASGLTLVTSNVAEFRRVAGLTIEDWRQ
jgi:tRNA(fMet)-specific endonuclease VapC